MEKSYKGLSIAMGIVSGVLLIGIAVSAWMYYKGKKDGTIIVTKK